MSTFLYTVASIVFGGMISAAVGYYFALQASRELREEADKLRGMVNALALHLESADVIEAEWEEDGNLKRYKVVALSGVIESGAEVFGDLTVGTGAPPNDQDHEASPEAPRSFEQDEAGDGGADAPSDRRASQP